MLGKRSVLVLWWVTEAAPSLDFMIRKSLMAFLPEKVKAPGEEALRVKCLVCKHGRPEFDLSSRVKIWAWQHTPTISVMGWPKLTGPCQPLKLNQWASSSGKDPVSVKKKSGGQLEKTPSVSPWAPLTHAHKHTNTERHRQENLLWSSNSILYGPSP